MVTVAPATAAPRPALTWAGRLVVGAAELVTVTVALTRRVEEPVPARLRSTAVPDVPPQAAVTRARRTIRFMVRSFAITFDRPHRSQARPRDIVRASEHALPLLL